MSSLKFRTFPPALQKCNARSTRGNMNVVKELYNQAITKFRNGSGDSDHNHLGDSQSSRG